jgi:hypothetical protein
LEGQVLSTSGVVTGNYGSGFFIQDGYGDWNGLYIYDPGRNPNVGDSVIVTGTISEYYGLTEMKSITGYYYISADNVLPAPKTISTGDAGEALEGVLVNVTNAVCTDANYQANFYMWTVNDGSGNLLVHNTAVFEYVPEEGESYDITGPLTYDFDEWKIELRDENDVKSGNDLIPPSLDLLEVINSTVIKLQFSESVEENSAENTTNYYINNGVIVEEANQHALVKSQVFLTVSTMENGDYTLNIKDIEDLSGNVMQPYAQDFSYLGIGELIAGGSLNMFPNPSTGNTAIEFEIRRDEVVRIKLFNVLGGCVHDQILNASQGNNRYLIDVSGLEPGVYLLTFAVGNELVRQRLIVN